MKPINLDDKESLEKFLKVIKICTIGAYQKLADTVGLEGRYGPEHAKSLANYAFLATIARRCRLKGDIENAIAFEAAANRIYREELPLALQW